MSDSHVVNAAGRKLPKFIAGYGPVKPFMGVVENQEASSNSEAGFRLSYKKTVPGRSKICENLTAALKLAGLRDGMTLSFHHHLREGDDVVLQTMKAVEALGVRNIVLASTALFNVHAPLVDLMKKGVVSAVIGSMNGAVGRFVSEGGLEKPCVLRSHGGRVRALMCGEMQVDIAIMAASATDDIGNSNGMFGRSAFGPFGYAAADSMCADKVIVVSDNLVPIPCLPAIVPASRVDAVVVVEFIGNPEKIMGGTLATHAQCSPGEEKMAQWVVQAAVQCGFIYNGFSFQAGAGSISLGVLRHLRIYMQEKNITARFAVGGVTAVEVEMMKQGLVEKLMDAQAFDREAAVSLTDHSMTHMETTIDFFYNHYHGICNFVDLVILGATEVDVDFNVNCNTHSDGYLLHGIGGHQDAVMARLVVITVPIARKAHPIIIDRVTTVTTPGECIDLVVSDVGIAVNPRRGDLLKMLANSSLPVKELRDNAYSRSGSGQPKPQVRLGGEDGEGRVVAVIEWRDGTVIDVVREVAPLKRQ